MQFNQNKIKLSIDSMPIIGKKTCQQGNGNNQ
jgi:hypothetical protein